VEVSAWSGRGGKEEARLPSSHLHPDEAKQGSESPLASEDDSGSVTPQSGDLIYTPDRTPTVDRKRSDRIPKHKYGRLLAVPFLDNYPGPQQSLCQLEGDS
jgi:hypothetical protein